MSNKEDLVPISQVLEDMYSDGYIASVARDYYYENYASESERKSMDIEDKINTATGIFILSLIPIGLILNLIK